MAITISGSGIVEANLADNAVTLAKMASGTDGEILTYDASGNPTSVSVGTDGQVLTSTGAGSPPAFETAAGGGGGLWQWVSNATFSGVASVEVTSITGSTLLVIENFIPATDNGYLQLQTSSNGGSSYDSAGTDYETVWQNISSATNTADINNSTGRGSIFIANDVANESYQNLTSYIYIENPEDTSSYTNVHANSWYGDSSVGGCAFTYSAGERKSASVVDAIKLSQSSGNISGTIRRYSKITS